MQLLFSELVLDIVADTMAVILHLENRKMPATAKKWFERAEQGNCQLGIPAMSLAEIGYLHEKGRIRLSVADVMDYVSQQPTIQVVPLTADVVQAAFTIPDIPELHDRLIAATAQAVAKGVLITNDPVIAASRSVTTVWQ